MKSIWIVNLGTVPYAEALALQHRIVKARKRTTLQDTLLLLEHPPVFTLGRNAHDSNILATSDYLRQLGIDVYRVERGGDVTYHGPNQLVGYPILDLRNFRQDVGWFVRSLEQALIRALGDFEIPARRIEKLVGVWVDNPAFNSRESPVSLSLPEGVPGPMSPDAKIAQIGARIEDWITYHGFALNVDPNLAHFDLIVPCGISDKAVTSMARVLGHPVDPGAVRSRVAARLVEVFDAEPVEVPDEEFYARLKRTE
ncbi:MAG: lipoyl(octanoyl) transferase LipB [Chloroflexi bacterium]|nr:lipoyl(octanoyl) transferase LipB [Chloroflexota bacterium]